MDIHPPSGRVESLKEIFTHIFIVTVGILIALSLEGVRELWREHTIVNEERDIIHAEMSRNVPKIKEDLDNLKTADAELAQILKEMPQLAKKPAEFQKRVGQLSFRRYGFSLEMSAWDDAIASGAIPHMSHDEVHRFSNYNSDMKYYLDITRGAFPVENKCKAYVLSHDTFSSAEAAAAEECLVELYGWTSRLEGNGPGLLKHTQETLEGPKDK
jgi:hypothetical protein